MINLHTILLEIARLPSVDALASRVVQWLATQEPNVVARIWLRREIASNQTGGDGVVSSPPLYLAATAGGCPEDCREREASCPDRPPLIPPEMEEVQWIAAHREPLESAGTNGEEAHPGDQTTWSDWHWRDGVSRFVGHPLIYGTQMLGILAVRTCRPLTTDELESLRQLADHSAAAIASLGGIQGLGQQDGELLPPPARLREQDRQGCVRSKLIGHGAAMRHVLQQIELVAPTDAGVLLLGESGTGKNLVAEEIHRRSTRCDRPMIKVNCGSIPRELYESEFFGHARGSFTGAIRDRVGRFELADGGTLFLDEVCEIPIELQCKLLHVLQEGEFERIGEESTRRCDVRVIAATNRNIRWEVKTGRFREDLFYRINVFPIELVPLRCHKEDIPDLAEFFVERTAQRLGIACPRLTRANLIELQQYDWPGNVRELQHVVERALILARGASVHFDLRISPDSEPSAPAIDAPRPSGPPVVLTDVEIRRFERDNLLTALAQTDWRIAGPGGAAELLGLRPTTLASRIKMMGLKKPNA